ncbi:MAG: EF-P 5-aminopentanol modification-associated protein YfmH [Planctomycetia bacterium]
MREPLTGRVAWRGRTAQGSDVWVLPMPGFTKAYASVTTRYGSIDTHLPDGTVLPVGIAHFLEHKMFQTREGDVFDLYAARGASANAYTTFDHTTYLFSCSSRFEDNLDTLYDTMASITTDPAAVEREKGIIGQEIAMYVDDPGWRGYFGMLEALYRRHPVRLDIAGTARTIAPIDPALLERTHAAYYHPANLTVVVAGDVDPSYVLARAGERLRAPRPGRALARRPVAEPRRVARSDAQVRLSIQRPRALLGWKEAAVARGLARVKRAVATALALDLLFGEGGRVQAPLYDEGLVDDSFGAAYEVGEGYAFGLLSAEVDAVPAYRKRLARALAAAARAPFSRAEVERARRKALGRHLGTFNSPEAASHYLLDVALEGAPLGSDVKALLALTPREVTRRRDELLRSPTAWVTLVPR